LRITGIEDKGVESLARELNTNTALKILNLDNNKIGDECAKSLAEGIQFNKKIEYLELENNQIGVEGVQALKDAFFKSNITLYSLELTSSSSGVAPLIKDIEDLTTRN